MNNRDRLIFLADKLDRSGHTAEASLVDEVIIKRSFDEETRGDINSVLQMTLQLLDELDTAVERGVAGLETEPGSGDFIKGWSGAIEDESLKNYYKDKINRLKEATEHVQGFTALTSEDTSPEEGPEEETTLPNPPPPTDEDESEEKPWWKFWEKSEEDEGDFDPEADRPPAEETTLPNPAPDETTFEEFDEELDEDEFDSDTGTVKRTRGRGVTVEQSMSNVGNVNIGYDETE